MVLNTLKNVVLQDVFARRTNLSVLFFLKDNWPADATIPVNKIEFSSEEFDVMKAGITRYVVIEDMTRAIKFAGTGASRYRVTDRKRIQILVDSGINAKQEKAELEEQIFSMINGNVRGMIADGIEQAFITEFQKIGVNPDDQPNKHIATGKFTQRSRAILTLMYDMAIA